MEFQVFHDYRRLADEGNAVPLTCPDCQSAYITRLGKDEEPVLWCVLCDAIVHPGLDLYDQLRKVLANVKRSVS